MSGCISGITDWLIRCEAIDPEDRELYEYAIHSLLLMLAPIFMAGICGMVMRIPVKGVLVILPFMVVRKFSGGYHAKKERNCLIGSSLLIMLCVYGAGHINYNRGLDGLIAIAVISLSIFSPIDSESRRLDTSEKKRYKFITCVIAILFGTVYMILVLCKTYEYAVCIAIGLMLSACLQMPCILKNLEN